MPSGPRHLWDLPLLMQRLHLHDLHQVEWRSRAVIVLRQPPTMWASHTSALTSSALHFETYLGIIEAVLRRCCAVADAPCSRNASCPVFVRYERILEAPLVELRALVGFGSDAGPLDITSAMAHGLLASYARVVRAPARAGAQRRARPPQPVRRLRGDGRGELGAVAHAVREPLPRLRARHGAGGPPLKYGRPRPGPL